MNFSKYFWNNVDYKMFNVIKDDKFIVYDNFVI